MKGFETKTDFLHRAYHWAEANKGLILMTFAGGVAFFGILAGTLAWKNHRENKAQEALYAAGDDAARLELFLKEYGSTHPALWGYLKLAQIRREAGEVGPCKVLMERMYEAAKKETLFRVTALHGMAHCHLANKEYAEAVPFFERAAKEPGHIAPALSEIEALRARELAGEEGVAKELTGYFQAAPEIKEAAERLWLWIQIKGS